MAARLTSNQKVTGSSPVMETTCSDNVAEWLRRWIANTYLLNENATIHCTQCARVRISSLSTFFGCYSYNILYAADGSYETDYSVVRLHSGFAVYGGKYLHKLQNTLIYIQEANLNDQKQNMDFPRLPLPLLLSSLNTYIRYFCHSTSLRCSMVVVCQNMFFSPNLKICCAPAVLFFILKNSKNPKSNTLG